MKKIININLSGRVIPIEDAAYESLQSYVESLRRYFAQEEGRDEIINDIESRIAELMNDKVKKGAPVVTEADMSDIINLLGRVEDFEQAETVETGATAAASSAGHSGTTESAPFTAAKGPRGRLYRDSSDKILGGVSSGLANYFGIDPAIVRILFVLLTFGAGMSIMIYLLLWIVVPAKKLEPTITKRLFRNPDDRILGGVAGGIAAYFNKDAWTIRLIFAAPLLLNMIFAVFNAIFLSWDHDFFPNFVIGSFTGTFFLTYIILWIILPEARSSFEKMEMRGEHVDVNRIRKNVQEEMENLKSRTQTFFEEEIKPSAQNLSNRAREFAGTRGKAFTEDLTQRARPAYTGIGRVIGIIIKTFLLAIGGIIAFSFFIVIIFFLFGGGAEFLNGYFFDSFGQKFLGWSAMLLLIGVPIVALLTFIIRRVMKVRTHSRYLGWTFGGLWGLGILLAILFGGAMFRSFRSSARVQEPLAVSTTINSMTVTMSEPEIESSDRFEFFNDDEDRWSISSDSMMLSDIKLRVEKSEDSFYHVIVKRYSRGSTSADSRKRAEQISYHVAVSDSLLDMGSALAIARGQSFRGQKVMVSVQVPVGKSITFDQKLYSRMSYWDVRVKEEGSRFYYGNDDLDWHYDASFKWTPNTRYFMQANGKLIDPLKPAVVEEDEDNRNNDVYEYEGGIRKFDTDSLEKNIKQDLERRKQDLERRIRDRDRETDTIKISTAAPSVPVASPVLSLMM